MGRRLLWEKLYYCDVLPYESNQTEHEVLTFLCLILMRNKIGVTDQNSIMLCKRDSCGKICNLSFISTLQVQVAGTSCFSDASYVGLHWGHINKWVITFKIPLPYGEMQNRIISLILLCPSVIW